MHQIRLSIFALGLIAIGCKTKSVSEVKATPAQLTKLRACIVSTVLGTFPDSKSDRGAVNKFADDMVAKAPTSNNKEKDLVFESYVNGLGCDPSRVATSDNYGLTIVEQWLLSAHNTQLVGPKDSSATELKSLTNRGAR